MTLTVSWAQIVTVIGAFVAIQGAFAYHLDRRFEDLKEWIRAEVRRLDERIPAVK